MLGEFKFYQHVFVHLFGKKLLFDINGLIEFLSTKVYTFLANLFQKKPLQKSSKKISYNFGD